VPTSQNARQKIAISSKLSVLASSALMLMTFDRTRRLLSRTVDRIAGTNGLRDEQYFICQIEKFLTSERGENFVKVPAVLSTILGSIPRVLTKGRTNNLRDMAIF